MSILSEISILWYCSIFITQASLHLKNMWIILSIFLKSRSNNYCEIIELSYFFKGKLSSELNLAFMKSFPYSPRLLSIFSIISLILFQSSAFFINISLFLSLFAKTKYLFASFSSMYPSTLLITKYK